MLKLESLTKKFGELRAVDDVSIEIPGGQMVGIIGRSGAGKSTLLRMINRLGDATSGDITFQDNGEVVDVNRLKGKALRQWRSRCAMIFQQFNLVPRLDVITNALMGRIGYNSTMRTLFKLFSPAERAFAIQALDRLDVSPQALQRADTLSGGQQQRVAIARALVQEPRLLLADEPISSLDPRNASIVMEALRKINREDGITVEGRWRRQGGNTVQVEGQGGGCTIDVSQTQQGRDRHRQKGQGTAQSQGAGQGEGCTENEGRGENESCPEIDIPGQDRP